MDMASYGGSYPYYQPATAPYYYSYAQQPVARGGGGASRPPVHLFVLVATLLLLVATSLYAWCEAAVESMFHQLRPLLIVSPLLLIVAAQLWLATSDRRGGGGLGHLLSQLAPGEYYQSGAGAYGRWDGGGGSSPWGVAVALVLVLLLVSYQTSFQEWRLFPPRRR